MIREKCVGAIGIVGGFINYLVGGFDTAVMTLILFMVIDYIFGATVAVVFKNSTKTNNGKYSSYVAIKGIVKKCGYLILIIIGAQIDILIGKEICRSVVTFGLIANEGVSIIENVALTGARIPQRLKDVLEVMQEDGDKKL